MVTGERKEIAQREMREERVTYKRVEYAFQRSDYDSIFASPLTDQRV